MFVRNRYWRTHEEADGVLLLDHGFECVTVPISPAAAAALRFFEGAPRSIQAFASALGSPVAEARDVVHRWVEQGLLLPAGFDQTAALRRSILSRPVRHAAQVSSFGGVGTTLLQGFLADAGVSMPTERDCGPWKHMPVPPTDEQVDEDFRVIYVFGDPAEAVVSVFRRGLADFHIRRMLGPLGAWPDGATLAEYLAFPDDPFRTAAHFDAWWGASRRYPILFVRYDDLWERIDEVVEFVGLPAALARTFPARRARQSRVSLLPTSFKAGLDNHFGALGARLGELDGLDIHRP